MSKVVPPKTLKKENIKTDNKKRGILKSVKKRSSRKLARKRRISKNPIKIKTTLEQTPVVSFQHLLHHVRERVHKTTKESKLEQKSPFILDLQSQIPQKHIEIDSSSRMNISLIKQVKKAVKKITPKTLSKSQTTNEHSLSCDKTPKGFNDNGRFLRDVMQIHHVIREQDKIKKFGETNDFNTNLLGELTLKPYHRIWRKITFWIPSREQYINGFHLCFVKFRFQALALFVVYALVSLPILATMYFAHAKFVKAKISQEFHDAFSRLPNSSNLANDESLQNVQAHFTDIQEAFGELDVFMRTGIALIPNIGQEFKKVRTLLTDADDILKDVKEVKETLSQLMKTDNDSVYDKLLLNKKALDLTTPILKRVYDITSTLDANNIPEEYRNKYIQIQNKIPVLHQALSQMTSLTDLAISVLGKEKQKRYMIVFQNNSELRPTGGFMGSFALVDVYKGEIRNIEVPEGGMYDISGQVDEKIISPLPMHLINAKWEAQDANWFFDWKTSAEKIKWFFYKSGGPTVDGVIAIDAFVLQRFLAIVGPIELTEYGVTVTSENFISVIQNEVEFGADKRQNKPKKIIGVLTEKIIDKFINDDENYNKKFDLFSVLLKSLEQKDILISLDDEQTQKQVESRGWAGKVKESSRDYLAIVDINIGGEKTNMVIKQSVHQTVEIDNEGNIIDTVKITRRHDGKKGDPLTGVRNISYLKVFVPWMSELISADGFEKPDNIYFEDAPSDYKNDEYLLDNEKFLGRDSTSGTDLYEESGKTVFGNWIQLDAGDEKTVIIKYKLPFSLKFQNGVSPKQKGWFSYFNKQKNNEELQYYTLLVQKQSGTWPTPYTIDVKTPLNWTIQWTYPYLKNNMNFKNILIDSDKMFGAIFEKNNI